MRGIINYLQQLSLLKGFISSKNFLFVVHFLHLYTCIRIKVLNYMMLSNYPCNYDNCFFPPRISPRHEGFLLQCLNSWNDLSARKAIDTYVCVASVVHSLIIIIFFLINFSMMAFKNIIVDLNKGDKVRW